MLNGFLKAHRPPKEPNKFKYTNEKMTRTAQDTNLSSDCPRLMWITP